MYSAFFCSYSSSSFLQPLTHTPGVPDDAEEEFAPTGLEAMTATDPFLMDLNAQNLRPRDYALKLVEDQSWWRITGWIERLVSSSRCFLESLLHRGFLFNGTRF